MINGNVEMALGIESGRVVMHFKEPMQTIRFDPQNIIDIACRMTDMAFEAQSDLKPAGHTLKAELIQRHREVLTTRIALMLGSLRNDRRLTDGQISQKLVDAALSEIF